MSSNLVPFTIPAAVLVLAVIALYLWRRSVAAHEDDTIHVLSDAGAIPEQVTVAHKLAVIDRWGKLVTIVAAVYGIAIGVLFVYQQWAASGRTIVDQ